MSDIRGINVNKELLIPTDKKYQKHTNVPQQIELKNINCKSKLLAEKLAIDDRIEKIEETEAYITVKDHKEDFPHKLSFRLINPS